MDREVYSTPLHTEDSTPSSSPMCSEDSGVAFESSRNIGHGHKRRPASRSRRTSPYSTPSSSSSCRELVSLAIGSPSLSNSLTQYNEAQALSASAKARMIESILESNCSGYGWRFGDDIIKDTYMSNYNIRTLHEKICKEYHKVKLNLTGMSQLVKSELLLAKVSRTEVSRRNHMWNAHLLRRRTVDLANDFTFNMFLCEVEDILTKFDAIGTSSTTISFRRIKGQGLNRFQSKYQKQLKSQNPRKAMLIERYIAVASRYANISIIKVYPRMLGIQQCCNCEEEIGPKNQCTSGLVVCPHCHVENTVTFNNSMNRDEMAMVQTKEDSTSNFENALRKYTGMQDPQPPPELIKRINDYMRLMKYPTSEDVKDLPLNQYNQKPNTSCKMILDALHNIKEVTYYEDVHLIASMLWGWVLPDLRRKLDTILRHFRATQRVFNSMHREHRGRNSAPGIQFRLYAHLCAVGHNCRFEDFKIPPSSLVNHLNNWKYMCKHSKIPELVNMPDLPLKTVPS